MIRSISASVALILAVPATLEPCSVSVCTCTSAARLGLTAAGLVAWNRDRAERVVLGTVVRIDTLAPAPIRPDDKSHMVRRVVARVRAERIWRGPNIDTLTVVNTTVELKWSCEQELVLGESYVIFAQRLPDHLLSAPRCSGTVIRRDAAPTLAVLGAGDPTPPSR